MVNNIQEKDLILGRFAGNYSADSESDSQCDFKIPMGRKLQKKQKKKKYSHEKPQTKTKKKFVRSSSFKRIYADEAAQSSTQSATRKGQKPFCKHRERKQEECREPEDDRHVKQKRHRQRPILANS